MKLMAGWQVRAAIGAAVVIGSVGISMFASGTAGAAASATTPTWTKLSTATNPLGRRGASMAYDTGTGQLILFGGTNTTGGGGTLSTTWTWNGSNWTRLSPATSPPSRKRAFMAYDPGTRQLILFGGCETPGTCPLSTTWDWTGTTWTKLSPATSPPARWYSASMAYDPATSQLLLFTGTGATTWEWNGTNWTKLHPATNPPDGMDYSMAYDSGTTQLILFQGSTTWTWNGTNWSKLSPATRPPSRGGQASMSYDSGIAQLILFGGGQSSTSTTWTWNGTTWTELSPATSPPGREAAAMAYDPATFQLLLFGGDNTSSTDLSTTWVFTGPSTTSTPPTTWTQLSPSTSPAPRYEAAGAYDTATSQFLLFGGYTESGYVGDTWDWNGTTWSQLSPATSPSDRGKAAMAYDPATSQLLLFGGLNASGRLGDTWDWNGTTWTKLSPATSPSARYAAAMAYDPATSQLLLFGGFGPTSTYLNDTWEWNGTTWTKLSPATSPPDRRGAAMAYDPATTQLLLFGGNSTTTTYKDTWEWSGTDWTKLSPATSPSARTRPAFAYDQTSDQLILFGGEGPSSSFLGDTWDWSGTTWTQLSPTMSPSARTQMVAGYDPVNEGIVLFGGFNATLLGDTWVYGPTAPGAPTGVSATAGNAQATVSFTAPPTDGGAPITSYTATATDETNSANGGQVASGSSSPITVTGLTNGNTYTFRVTATNRVGTGPASTPSNAVVPATVPGAPTGVSAIAGNAQATVSWTAPATNGSAITSYTVMSSGGQQCLWATGPLTCTVTGLTNGDTYTFTVTAKNGVGTGPASTPSNPVVPKPPVTFTSVSPSRLGQGASKVVVTLAGSGFTTGATVSVSGTGVSLSDLSVVSSTTITAKATVSASAATGSRNLTVNDSNGSATCTGCLTVDAHPILTGTSPTQMAAGAKGTVTFTGSGFETGATVKFVATTFKLTKLTVTTTSITATVRVPQGAPIGSYTVEVTNPDKGTATCSDCFTVIASPTVTAIHPTSVAKGTTTPVTITGTGFAAGAKLKGPTGVVFSKIDVVNSTTIDATMTVFDTATVGTDEPVTVTNNATAGYGKATGDVLTIT